MRWFVIQLIRTYRFLLSPWLGGHCRFHPSCSSYAIAAIDRHGVLQGGALALGRLLRCHPWHPGGIDEVPKQASLRAMLKLPGRRHDRAVTREDSAQANRPHG